MANRIVSLKDYELYLLKFRYHFYLLLSEGMRMPWCVGGWGADSADRTTSKHQFYSSHVGPKD